MHAIPNHVNSNFQILYFLIGSCHTVDGAYALLCNLREGREMALSQIKASELREKAKIVRAERLRQSADEADQLEGEADLAEIEAHKENSKRCIAAATSELDFINKCINRLQPHRKFQGLRDDEAHQAAQREEWKLELIRRAENHLLTSGTLPADQYDTMRQHPDYLTDISPCIQGMLKALAIQGGRETLLHQVEATGRKISVQLTNLIGVEQCPTPSLKIVK